MDLLIADVNDYSLYHATTALAAYRILALNKLEARSKYSPDFDLQYYGISFTRSLQYAKSWDKSDVIFSVDYRLLKRHYRIVQRGKTNWTTNFYNRFKAEEFVVIGKGREISNFNNFINMIYMKDRMQYKAEIIELCNKYSINFQYI